jgi:hypothetical protein
MDDDAAPVSQEVRHERAHQRGASSTCHARHYTYRIPTGYLQDTYRIPTGYLHDTCSIPAAYLQHTCSIPAAYLQHTCSIPAAYLQHTYSIPTALDNTADGSAGIVLERCRYSALDQTIDVAALAPVRANI